MSNDSIFGDAPVQLSQEEMADPTEKIAEIAAAWETEWHTPKKPVSPEIAGLLASLGPLVKALSDDDREDFEKAERAAFMPTDAEMAVLKTTSKATRLVGYRERLGMDYFDTIILRKPPGEFDRFPVGWCSSDVVQIDENRELRFFTGESIGNRKRTNLEMAGGFSGDQTGVFRHARLHIVGSRLTKEHLAAFLGTVVHFSAGCKRMVTEPLEAVASSSDVGLVLAQHKLSDIQVPARQNWGASIDLPDAAIRLLPYLEMLRLVTSWTVTRDVQ